MGPQLNISERSPNLRKLYSLHLKNLCLHTIRVIPTKGHGHALQLQQSLTEKGR